MCTEGGRGAPERNYASLILDLHKKPPQEEEGRQERICHDYNYAVLVWVLDNRVNKKPPQEVPPPAPSAPPRPQMSRISRISNIFQGFLNVHLENLKNLWCFTMFSFHQVAKYCKTLGILEILEVYIQKTLKSIRDS